MKQKIALFLSTSMPYGIIMGIILGKSLLSGLISGLIAGLLFGFILTWILWLIQRHYLKKAGLDKKKIRTSYLVELRAEGSKDEVFNMCLGTISRIHKGSIEQCDRQRGIIAAKAGLNWRTWGDRIRFEIEEIRDNQCRIQTTSRPIVPTTLIDYGKNAENIKTIMDDLRTKTAVQAVSGWE